MTDPFIRMPPPEDMEDLPEAASELAAKLSVSPGDFVVLGCEEAELCVRALAACGVDVPALRGKKIRLRTGVWHHVSVELPGDAIAQRGPVNIRIGRAGR